MTCIALNQESMLPICTMATRGRAFLFLQDICCSHDSSETQSFLTHVLNDRDMLNGADDDILNNLEQEHSIENGTRTIHLV